MKTDKSDKQERINKLGGGKEKVQETHRGRGMHIHTQRNVIKTQNQKS